MDVSCVGSPKINQTVFPATPANSTWANETSAGSTDASFVDFSNGDFSAFAKSNLYYVRLVRGAPSVTPLTAQTIQFGAAPAPAVGAGAAVVTAHNVGAHSSNAITFTGTTPATCTVLANGLLVPVAAGTCTIAADQLGRYESSTGTDYAPATQVTLSVTVAPQCPSTNFSVALNVPGTVTQLSSGRMWRQCVEGLSGASCATGSASKLDWQTALGTAAASRFAGFNDWREATFAELVTLFDQSCGEPGNSSVPTINQTVFPASPADGVWTSETYSANAALALFVDFSGGGSTADEKTSSSFARILRGGPSSGAPTAQIIALTAPTTLLMNGTATVTAVNTGAHSSNAITFTSLTPLTCSVNLQTGVVSPVAAGICTIAADQYGRYESSTSTDYAQATQATKNITIPVAINGTCGSASSAVGVLVAPVDSGVNLCAVGTPTVVASSAASFTWGCTGASGGTSTSACAAPHAYSITGTVASPATGGVVSCTVNPVVYGGNSACTVLVNAPYVFNNWSGDCVGIGAVCALTNVTGSRSVTANILPTLNVDGSNASTRYQPLVDGMIVLRFMQGATGPALTAGTRVTGATITDPAAMATYLSSLGMQLDIDGNGAIDPATDGLLVMRYMLGLRGTALINNALGALPRTRSSATEIEAWLAALMPLPLE